MRRMGRAFVSAREVYDYLQSESAVQWPAKSDGEHSAEFTVRRRVIVLVEDVDIPSLELQSSLKDSAAKPIDDQNTPLRYNTRYEIFCVDYAPLPPVVPTSRFGLTYGDSPSPNTPAPRWPATLAELYSPLYLRCTEAVSFRGRWRLLTCDCATCAAPGWHAPPWPSRSPSTAGCTSHGAGNRRPAPWVPWEVRAEPPKNRMHLAPWVTSRLIELRVISMSDAERQSTMAKVAQELIDWNVYKQYRASLKFVEGVFKSTNK